MIIASNIPQPASATSANLSRPTSTTESHVPNFNRLARIYRWLEWFSFGPVLQRCRCALLHDLASPRQALVLGDGDGRFTAELLARNSALQIDAVDASSAMLTQLLQAAAQNANRVTSHLGDARTWAPAASHYDLIATHFFLDCLTTGEVAALAARIRSHVDPASQWLVSEFAVPTGLFGKFIAHPLIALLYRAFRLLTGLRVQNLPNHREALAQAGFTLARERKSLGGILVAELWIPIPYPALDGDQPLIALKNPMLQSC